MPTNLTRPSLTDDTGSGSDGDVIDSAFMGSKVYDPVDAIFNACAKAQVYHSAAVSLSTGVNTTLSFDTEEHDAFAMHAGGSPSRLTVPVGMTGVFLVMASVSYAANATGIRGARLVKNGVTDLTIAFLPAVSSSGLGPTVVVSWLGTLTAGDYVEVQAFQDSGGALNTGSAGRVTANQFSITRVI